jgi:hypothetical protein
VEDARSATAEPADSEGPTEDRLESTAVTLDAMKAQNLLAACLQNRTAHRHF